MILRNIAMIGMILLALAFVTCTVNATVNSTDNSTAGIGDASGVVEQQIVDDIQADDGIGPDNVLYRLKLTFEDLDVVFTFNDSEKVGKQVSQARHRIAEIKSALNKQNLKAVDIAIEQYGDETKMAEDSISKIKNKDTGLLHAQEEIAKHSYVLERLLESHPNNTGLLRAYNNSERLLDNFTSKTSFKLERGHDENGRDVVRHVKVEDDESGDREKTTVKAEVEDTKTKIKVELKFNSNSTEPAGIARDVLARIDSIESNVSGILKIERHNSSDDQENDSDDDDVNVTEKNLNHTAPKDIMKGEAEVKGNTTKVSFEYSFSLNVTNDAGIISGVREKLSGLTASSIQGAMDIKVSEKREEKTETNDDHRNVNESEKEHDNGNQTGITGDRHQDENQGKNKDQ